MYNDYEEVDQRVLKAIIRSGFKTPDVILYHTDDGIEVILRDKDVIYKLITSRKQIRLFKSPATAINYLANFGVKRVIHEGLENWKPDCYVEKNQTRNSLRSEERR